MPAVVNYDHFDGAVDVREMPVPTIDDDSILMQVGAASVCGSDIHMWRNSMGHAVNRPVILGHEFCGTVAAKGRAVRGFKEGDRVVSETAAYICGECIYCRSGEYNICPKRLGFGYGVHGAFTRFVKVPARCLHPLPDRFPLEEAALTEPTCVAYNALAVKSQIRPGDFVVVLGPGPIGLLSIEVARLMGAGKIAVTGIGHDAKRLEVARALGADLVINCDTDDAIATVLSQGDGLGADLVVDAVGISESLRQALEMVRPNGQITKIGWGPKPFGFTLDPLVAKAARLQGSYSHNYRVWERVIELLADGKLRTKPLISITTGLEGWHKAFHAMESGDAVKAVFTTRD